MENKIETSGQVALPFNEDQFKDFIVSLLGKPQTISKNISGYFEVDKSNLIGLYERIVQRVSQQNDSKLIQFRATIYYNDNSTVTLNGLEHLIHYNENLPLISRAVHLTWQFLVKFRDKETFEKQEISISFIADGDGPVPILDSSVQRGYIDSGINFLVSHTARTWGADIEGLLTKNLSVFVKKESKFLDYFRYRDENVNTIIFSIIFTITFIFSIKNTNIILNQTENPALLIKHYGNLIFLYFGIYIIYKLAILGLEEFQFYRIPSFILLTPESEKNKNKVLSKYRYKVFYYFVTAVISILLSIIGNYCYDFIIN